MKITSAICLSTYLAFSFITTAVAAPIPRSRTSGTSRARSPASFGSPGSNRSPAPPPRTPSSPSNFGSPGSKQSPPSQRQPPPNSPDDRPTGRGYRSEPKTPQRPINPPSGSDNKPKKNAPIPVKPSRKYKHPSGRRHGGGGGGGGVYGDAYAPEGDYEPENAWTASATPYRPSSGTDKGCGSFEVHDDSRYVILSEEWRVDNDQDIGREDLTCGTPILIRYKNKRDESLETFATIAGFDDRLPDTDILITPGVYKSFYLKPQRLSEIEWIAPSPPSPN